MAAAEAEAEAELPAPLVPDRAESGPKLGRLTCCAPSPHVSGRAMRATPPIGPTGFAAINLERKIKTGNLHDSPPGLRAPGAKQIASSQSSSRSTGAGAPLEQANARLGSTRERRLNSRAPPTAARANPKFELKLSAC